MLDDQPEWIRDLYRDIYPNAPFYPVGPRNNPATRVSGWSSRNQITNQRFPNESQALGMAQLPSNMNPPTGGLAPNITGSINPNWETQVTPNVTPPNAPDTSLLFGPMSRPPPTGDMTRINPLSNFRPNMGGSFSLPNNLSPPANPIMDYLNQVRTRNINRRGPGRLSGNREDVYNPPTLGTNQPPMNIRRDVPLSGVNNTQLGTPEALLPNRNNPLSIFDILRYLFGGRSQREEIFIPR